MSNQRRNVFVTLALAGFMLIIVSCGTQKKISIEDQLIQVGQTVEPEVIFTPADSIDSYAFSTIDNTIISITGHVILGLKVGEATVKAETANTNVSTTFKVTVTAAEQNLSIADFNEAGTFENGLQGWTLSGETADVMDVDTDGDRGEDDYQLKFWTDGLIDFTLSYTIRNLLASEEGYTIRFDVTAGDLNNFIFKINNIEYKWLDNEVQLGSASYARNYYFFEHETTSDITFTWYIYAELREEGQNVGWGFIDDIYLEEGNKVPAVEKTYKNYVVNGGFENNLTTWSREGTLSDGATYTTSSTAKTGQKAFNFWNNNKAGSDFEIFQVIETVKAGSNYVAKIYVLNGDAATLPLTTTFYVIQGSEIHEVAIATKTYGAGYTEYTIENLTLNGTESVKIGLHITAGAGNIWMHVDDIQLLNLDETE